MDFFYFLAAFLLVRRLHKSLKTSFLLYPKWKTILITASWLIIGVYVVNVLYLEDAVRDLIGSGLLFGLIYFANKEPDFESQRTYLYANIPLAIVGLVTAIAEFIAPVFVSGQENYIALAIIAAFVWIFGRW